MIQVSIETAQVLASEKGMNVFEWIDEVIKEEEEEKQAVKVKQN